ncbi:hypothetical protein ACFYO0_44955 [Streptomyces sp. NPDC006365]|uniref:hypothetical protein n=1 Tax=Streptomyces sp. NPDC006365 TaxID=3364744 RepID=UPI00367B6C79
MRPRLAVQEAGRALGYPIGRIREMTRHIHHHEPPAPDADVPADVRELAAQLHKLPRHLGVHSGGMVLTRQPIGEIMPWSGPPPKAARSCRATRTMWPQQA